MNKNVIFLVAIIALLILGGAYFAFSKPTQTENLVNQAPVTNSGENPEPGSIHDLTVEPAAVAARKDLATRLSINEKNIVIMQITEETWSDGCLGLGQANESCLMALVPGFKVEMVAQGKNYIYRTDQTGLSLRIEK